MRHRSADRRRLFYDFVVEKPFVPEDLERIEARMRELAAADFVYERQLWPARKRSTSFARRGEPLKVQLIEEKTEGQKTVSVYTIKDRDLFVDFCVGPHVPTSGRLKGFKLLNTSNAYWKGDARNQPMQRIYGTAFFSDKELQAHLTQIEEAKKRDHRKVGRELGLFMFPSVGGRFDVLARQGHDAVQPARQLHAGHAVPVGYVEVKTPLVFNKALWETSGHWAHYRGEHVPDRAVRLARRGRAGSRAARAQGDELPRAHVALRERGAQLSRPAAPLSRTDAAASQRAVRHTVRPHEGAAARPG
jgi:threonyl-tRNA synthetase